MEFAVDREGKGGGTVRLNSSVVRVLAVVLTVLASLLVSTSSSSAQVKPSSSRGEAQSERSALAEIKSNGSSVAEECRMRSGQRHSRAGHSPHFNPVRMCVCDGWGRSKGHVSTATTARHPVFRTTRSVELPLLHQVFRC